MIQLTIYISEELSIQIEEHFCEVGQNNWMIYEDKIKNDYRIVGYFQDEKEMEEQVSALNEYCPLPDEGREITILEDQDWKESYKKHFTAWTQGNLHWVPNWKKDTYPLPEGHKMLLIDPGMAFGTGNHPTTRLCVEAILSCREKWADELEDKIVIDAGCGSGILALSAALVGFKNITAFDNDADAIRISIENAEFNNLSGAVDFKTESLECLDQLQEADLLIANIQSNVLIEFSDYILNNVRPGSTLCLSGILAKEEEKVLSHYKAEMDKLGLTYNPEVVQMDEWISITFPCL